jgi:hypothetical protein
MHKILTIITLVILTGCSKQQSSLSLKSNDFSDLIQTAKKEIIKQRPEVKADNLKPTYVQYTFQEDSFHTDVVVSFILKDTKISETLSDGKKTESYKLINVTIPSNGNRISISDSESTLTYASQ